MNQPIEHDYRFREIYQKFKFTCNSLHSLKGKYQILQLNFLVFLYWMLVYNEKKTYAKI